MWIQLPPAVVHQRMQTGENSENRDKTLVSIINLNVFRVSKNIQKIVNDKMG